MKTWCLILSLLLQLEPQAQFAGFQNKGLVGVGRIAPNEFDKSGPRRDTLGGFSALTVDRSTLRYSRGTVSGTLYGLPDRGYGDGSTDFTPRIQVYDFTLEPYSGSAPTEPNQIRLTNRATILLTCDNGKHFTGFDAGDSRSAFPQSAINSPGKGRRSLDPEGIAMTTDGAWWIADEYGPTLLKFSPRGELRESLSMPPAIRPLIGGYPGKANFTATNLPTSGRRNNRGLESLSLTPDGRTLLTMLQSPTVQDGGAGNLARNTRVLKFDVAADSPNYGRLIAEHIYELTLKGDAQTNRQTVVNEIIALDSDTLLVLERDSHGRGSGFTNLPVYKRIVLASTLGKSNIAGTGYDLENGAPGQRSLPTDGLPKDIQPASRIDFIDLLDQKELARFRLSATSNPEVDPHAISEKWEALGLVPLQEQSYPDDFFLLVANDNDFKAPVVFHNGQPVATNRIAVDIMVLAYRVTLPGIRTRHQQ